jgi:hypothetical protein
MKREQPSKEKWKVMQKAENFMLESDLLATVLDLAQANGWLCHHEYISKVAPRGRKGAKRTNPGYPDIIAFRTQHNPLQVYGIAIELKKAGETPTREQMNWLTLYRRMGFRTYVWRPSDLNSGLIEAVLRGDNATQA